MRIYVELPFSPRNSPFLSLSLPLSLSRSPANRARNDSLRIFEISLFQNPSSLNISIPSYPSIITSSVSTKNIRIIAWKKKKRNCPSSLYPFSLREKNKNKNGRKEENANDESIISVAKPISISPPIDNLSFVFFLSPVDKWLPPIRLIPAAVYNSRRDG